jgi:hypothetical protein
MTDAIPMTVLKVSHHSAAHIAARYPYAAYGSNLMMRQINERCPNVELVTGGKLLDFRLDFARVATITTDKDSTVPVGIYALTARDIERLDKREGMGRVYDRFLVTAITDDGRAMRCFTYIKKASALEPPSGEYYAKLLEGYRDWTFDDRRLRHARDRAVKTWAAAQPAREAAARATAKMVAKYRPDAYGPSAGDYWAQGDMLEPISPPGERRNVVDFPVKGIPRFLTMAVRGVEWGTRDGQMYFRCKGARHWYRDVSMPDQISQGMVMGELATNLPGAAAYKPLDTKKKGT